MPDGQQEFQWFTYQWSRRSALRHAHNF